jgi:rhodanese-related sulfurtransferase
MKKLTKLLMLLLPLIFGCMSRSDAQVQNPKYQKRLQTLLSHDVPEIEVKTAKNLADAVFVDAREKGEYEVSHIKNAVWVGYDDFDMKRLRQLDKNKPVVVYCSVGYRSERITKKLQNAGFKKVYNLYGGLFEWYNEGYPMVNKSGQPTQKIHAYNKNWSQWVEARNEKDVIY